MREFTLEKFNLIEKHVTVTCKTLNWSATYVNLITKYVINIILRIVFYMLRKYTRLKKYLKININTNTNTEI